MNVRRIGLIVLAICSAAGAQTVTPNLGLTLPEIHSPNWGTVLNTDFTLIDTFASGTGLSNTLKGLPNCNLSGYVLQPSSATCILNGSGGGIGYPSGSGIVVVVSGTSWGTTLAAPAGAIVGTSDTQTLTNKTVDGVTPTVFGYLDATSSIQNQLNLKAPLASPTFTGSVTLPITGSTQCLHVNSAGVTSGTGSDCDSGAVASVFGRSGVVVATSGDYTASQVTNAVANNSSNTYSTGIQSLSAATGLIIPNVSSIAATTGELIFNTTIGEYEGYSGSGWVFPWIAVGGATSGHCAYWISAYNLGDSGSACGSGGSSAFSAITSSTNTTAAMIVGTGATLSVTGSGTIAATTAATLATPRTIAGTSFNGSANIALANHFIVQGTTDSGLSGAQFLGALATGLVKNTTSTGVLSIGTSADVIADWTGSCSSSTFLRGDGACATATGSTGISGLTSGYIPLAGSATTITANSHLDEVTNAGEDTFTQPVVINAAGTPSQEAMTYNSTVPTVGSSTTAVYAVNSSGLAVISEAGGAFAEICSATNGVCTGGGGSISFPQTVGGTTTSGGIPYFSGTTVLSSSGILNSNILVKGGGAGTAPTNSSITDNGSTVSTAEALTALTLTATGTTAGYLDLPQGTSNSAGTTSIRFQAPPSVTSQLRTWAGTPATGYGLWTNVSGTMTETLVNAIPIANVGSAGLSGTSPVAITSAGAISCTTCGVTGSPLSQFASTTSAQLAGVLSDETGTGVAVFSTSPTLVTPVLGAATATSLLASGNVDGTAPTTITTGTTATLGGTFKSGYTWNQEATAATAVAYTLPTAAAGLQYCVGNSWNGSAATTGVLTLAVSASGQFIIFTDGTLSATGGNVTSGGAAADFACVVGIDSTHWQLSTPRGTWTKH